MHSTEIRDFAADEVAVQLRGSGAPLVLLRRLGVDHRLRDIAAQALADGYTRISDDFGTTPVPNRAYAIADLFAATKPERVDRLMPIDTTRRYDDAARQMRAERARAARIALPCSPPPSTPRFCSGRMPSSSACARSLVERCGKPARQPVRRERDRGERR